MEAFEESCRRATSYPCNLVSPNVPQLELETIQENLRQEAPRLFCDDGSASVDILDVERRGPDCSLRTIHNEDELQKALGSPGVFNKTDPLCRMIFLYAPTSRDKLNVTSRMAQQIFTHHQVMPSFMEGLFPFGFREHGLDCNETSFHAYRPSYTAESARMPEIGRSGSVMQQCYGLRSVERSNGQSEWPWSVRQCSVYHSLDLETARATWIVVKANRIIEKYARDAMKSSPDWKELFPAPGSGTMAAVFNMHELIACWSGSNWQSYISFIENRLQGITRPALSVTTDDIGRTEPAIQPATMNEATLTEPAASSSQVRDGLEEMDEKWGGTLRQQSSFKQVVLRANSFIPNRKNVTKSTAVTPRTVWGHRFSFDDLPRLHFLEEKANEALDVLSNNVDILNALRDDYCSLEQQLIIDHGVPVWRTEMDRFARAIAGVQKTCKTQQARVRQLLRLIADRKALLQRILDYDSMQANRSLAEQAGESAKNMEDLAIKTKKEAVSMRIITLVTLFFLPGTFISTLMSTPIVRFAPGSPSTSDGNISIGALGFFCAVSLPLVVLTFVCWGFVYWWERRREVQRQKKSPASV